MIIDIETWTREFSPIKNYLIEDALFNGMFFSTEGFEGTHIGILAKNPKHKDTIWSVRDLGDSGGLYINSGRSEDALYYILTKRPYTYGGLYVNLPNIKGVIRPLLF